MMYPSINLHIPTREDTSFRVWEEGARYFLNMTIGNSRVCLSANRDMMLEIITDLSQALASGRELINKLPCGDESGGCSAAGTGCGGCENNPEVGNE